MLTCNEMAQKLEWAAVRARNELDIPTETLMMTLSAEAKGYIGHYQEDWAPLAPSTLADKTRKGFAPPDNPLLRTGDMRASIEFEASPGAGGAEGSFGSNDVVALWQEMGTSRGIPPRPFIGLAAFRSEQFATPIFGKFAVEILSNPR